MVVAAQARLAQTLIQMLYPVVLVVMEFKGRHMLLLMAVLALEDLLVQDILQVAVVVVDGETLTLLQIVLGGLAAVVMVGAQVDRLLRLVKSAQQIQVVAAVQVGHGKEVQVPQVERAAPVS